MTIKHLLKLPNLKGKKRQIAAGLNLLVIFCILSTLGAVPSVGATAFSSPASATPAEGETVGTPWTGEKGITQTSAQIMARERATAANSPKAHPQKPRLRANRQNLKQNPNSPAVAQFPTTTSSVKTRDTRPYIAQTPGTEFTGATLADTGAFPPDTMGTVGPSQFIVAVNGRFRSFNKNTGAPDGGLNDNPDVFFSPVMTPVGGSVVDNFTSDPKIRYDRLTNRWIIIIIDVPCTDINCATTAPNRVLFAVSDAASNGVITGSTAWTFYFFQNDTVSPAGDTGDFFDYPTLGVDANALYIGGNVFTGAGNFSNTTGFVVRKSSILSGGPIVVTAFRNLLDGAGSGPYTPQGVDNFDSTATVGYFIGVDENTSGLLQIRRISNPAGTPSISGNLSVTVPTTAQPLTVPHQGNTGGTNGRLDALDDRLFMAVIRNGSLWTAHNIAVTSAGVGSNSGDRDGSRWYQLQNLTTTPTLTQAGTIFDAAGTNPLFYWIPSIMVSGQGHVAMGFSAAGNNSFASAATLGRLAGDSLGTMQTPPIIYEAGAAAYNPPGDTGGGIGARRWGDYSYTSLDPEDDMTMWTIQEFTSLTNVYGVRAVKLIAPPPATPASRYYVIAGQASVNVTITGTSVSGSGFYDPGTGFAKRLAASVSGGVIVNSVTYVDPTHLTLNISTVGVSAGLKNVTITNPDGQSVTGTGTLSVLSGCTVPVTTTADDGTAGSFRSAVATANAGGCKIVDLTQLNPNATITLTPAQGGGVTVGAGVTLLGPVCGASGPTLTITGAGVTGDGLTLNGATVNGIWVRGFGGKQVVASPNGAANVLFCVKASKA